MGLKGIFLAFIIVFVSYFWWNYRKKELGGSSKWVNWVLVGIAVYYGLSAIILYLE